LLEDFILVYNSPPAAYWRTRERQLSVCNYYGKNAIEDKYEGKKHTVAFWQRRHVTS
jgi:hypothetical protein